MTTGPHAAVGASVGAEGLLWLWGAVAYHAVGTAGPPGGPAWAEAGQRAWAEAGQRAWAEAGQPTKAEAGQPTRASTAPDSSRSRW